MEVKTMGYLVPADGKAVLVNQKPSNKVVRYITKLEFDKHSNDIMTKYVVKEGLPSDNGIVIVYYIKG